ncbi:MAG: type II toxin-antitoxin system RelE/ParE family toxin [Candidatus Vogelbacteria bacterium]
MNLGKSWVLLVRKDVYRKLEKFPVFDRTRLTQVVESLSTDPFAGDVEKMGGEEDTWRRRVGSYRIFLELIKKDRVVYVFDVERRKSNTY